VPIPTRPSDRGHTIVGVTFDEVEEALGHASASLQQAKRNGRPTETILHIIDTLLDWRLLIISVWTSYAQRGTA
jgi:hypothetical protein